MRLNSLMALAAVACLACNIGFSTELGGDGDGDGGAPTPDPVEDEPQVGAAVDPAGESLENQPDDQANNGETDESADEDAPLGDDEPESDD